MKVIFYGVRDVEKPIFEAVNQKFGYDMTLIPEYLTDEATTRKAEGHDVVVLRGNCFATKERLDIYKEMGVQYVMTRTVRSEEHTSELQSRQYLVCRLLLEKKNDTDSYLIL